MNRHTHATLLRADVRGSNPSSVRAGLEPYTGLWERKQAAHLIRRVGFGAVKPEVDGALNDGSATAAVNRLFAEAAADPLPDPPSWYSQSSSTGIEDVYDIQRRWFESLRNKGLIEKMTLFWHNHFVTQYTANQQKHSASIGHLTYNYYLLLRKNALGNFKDFVRAVGKNAAMLIYLDGFVNEVGHANENYGRELMELFTMGQYAPDGTLNYTESDIKEVARALTGWVVTSQGSASFDPNRHDNGSKTFFGLTGNYGYDDVVDLIFQERGAQVAHHICRKLYTFFVAAVPDEAIVAQLATTFQAQNFEITPVVKQLLSSAHFYEQSRFGAQIKSPLAFLIGFLNEAEVIPTQALLEHMREVLTPISLGQELFNPPNVAGWPGLNPPDASNAPGHYTWLTTTTLPERWNFLFDLLYGGQGVEYDPIEYVDTISDPSDPFRVTLDLAYTLLAVPLEDVGIREVEEDFAGNSYPPPDEVVNGPAYFRNLSKILLDGTPYYEWPLILDPGSEEAQDVRRLVQSYMSYLIQLPAYQLT